MDEVTQKIYVADTGNRRVDEFSTAGAFIQAWGWGVENGAPEFQICTDATGCRAGLSGTNPGEFDSPAFVAVDRSPGGEGDVYVAEFDYQTEFNHEWGLSHETGPRIIQKFTAEGKLIESWGNKGQITQGMVPGEEGLSPIRGIAVLPAGGLLVDDIYEFDQTSGTYIPTQGREQTVAPEGIGVDDLGNVYFGSERFGSNVINKYNVEGVEVATLFTLGQPFVHASIGLAVAGSGELYVDEGNAIQVIPSSCVSHCAAITTFTSPELTKGAGVALDSQGETLYIAEAAAERIDSIAPEPPASPLVEAGSESVSNVSADSATLEAVVSPRSEASEEPTSYRFQYTTDERFQQEGFNGAESVPVPDGQLAPSFEAEPVMAHPQGLEPGTVYHFRVVAENRISRKEGRPAVGESNAGKEIFYTFITQIPNGFALPNGRVWELVSPPDKHGALLEPGGIQAAADGDAITYNASAPTESSPDGYSGSTKVLSMRGMSGGSSWGSRDISTPREVASGTRIGGTEEYRFFSTDLSESVVNPFGAFDSSLSGESSEQTAFLRTDFPSGDPTNPCVNGCYRPLVTGAAGYANVPENTEFGVTFIGAKCIPGIYCGPEFQGASPDGSHIVLSSTVALTEGAPAKSLYEWANGQLQLVSVLSGGEPAPTTKGVGLGFRSTEEVIGSSVSEDGSRIVWSTGSEASERLYVRDMVREETVELGGPEARFQTASVDGSRVLFTVKGDLYAFDAPLGGALSAGQTTDLVPGGGVIKIILGASRDDSSAYFVSNKVLTGTPSPHGEEARAGQPNLYGYRAGTVKLVAVLSSEDAPDWEGNGGGEGLMTTTRVSSDGRWLAFMSERSLTGYDNRDAVSGKPDEEVFLYDATANGVQGGVVCASCDPSGARPHGILDSTTAIHSTLVDSQGAWREAKEPWLAGNVPGWLSPLYQARYLSDSGRLFFNSADALVPSDINGTEDVYEYEPPGVGSCSSASVTFSARSGGCVALVSSGVSKEESAFLDASESGDDVFFLTSAQLSPADTDSIQDVYDARVGGGFPAPQPPPACEGDACQSPVAAPNDPTPGSLTYTGPGNPAPLLTVNKTKTKKAVKCTKGKKLVHGKCTKKKSKKAERASRARKASDRRRAKS